MRCLLLLLVACASTTRSSDRDYTRVVTDDEYVIVVERVDSAVSRPFARSGEGPLSVSSRRTVIGAAAIDFETFDCSRGDTGVELKDKPGFETVSATTVRVNGTLVEVPQFPLGTLAAIAPGRAVFDSPLGTIVFDGSVPNLPKKVKPLVARDDWWNAKATIAPGQTIRTRRWTVRFADGAIEAHSLETRRRFAATEPVVHFANTELVATADTLIDLSTSNVFPIAVDRVMVFDIFV